ncbi:nuclear valosin-containing protein-like [Sinocyclocheilus grahami]|uniref:nuclear valosin-containing protein-like n=1 Tax=Sinocyclocheilus grahami TaxID=75366 RepID=UPI0007AD52FA|nr:PREDICTED: nuclear valosin-containing protein-like [Sinocyclocheilus grahami]
MYAIVSPSFINTVHSISRVDMSVHVKKDQNAAWGASRGSHHRMCFQKQRDSSKLEKEKTSKSGKLKRAKKNKHDVEAEIAAGVQAKKSKNKGHELQFSAVKFEDFGGSEETLEEVCKLLIHTRHPEVYQRLGVVPPRGFLLHGPPGCGKTLLAQAVAGEVGLPMLKVSAPELVSGVSGESEQKLRELFEQAIVRVTLRPVQYMSVVLWSKAVNYTGKPVSCSSCCQKADLEQLLSLLKRNEALSEEQLSGLCVLMSDFRTSLARVQPSAKREGFATVPDVTWEDVGALQDIREELNMAIMAPINNPEHFRALGLNTPAGVLLAGPPGCGKTLLAKAVANESGLNFISVKGPELLNMYVGESERAVRQVFQRGRNSAPCVIFFDEIDALCPRRSEHESGASARVVNQLLTEMDGMGNRQQVFMMAATNRPDIIDPAVLRPGRLDKTLYVGLPPPADRHAILVTITKNGTKPLLDSDVNLEEIAHDARCESFTGADLSALVREACVNALRVHLSSRPAQAHTEPVKDIRVSRIHFEDAFKKVRPSVSKKDQIMYEKLKETLTR